MPCKSSVMRVGKKKELVGSKKWRNSMPNLNEVLPAVNDRRADEEYLNFLSSPNKSNPLLDLHCRDLLKVTR